MQGTGEQPREQGREHGRDRPASPTVQETVENLAFYAVLPHVIPALEAISQKLESNDWEGASQIGFDASLGLLGKKLFNESFMVSEYTDDCRKTLAPPSASDSQVRATFEGTLNAYSSAVTLMREEGVGSSRPESGVCPRDKELYRLWTVAKDGDKEEMQSAAMRLLNGNLRRLLESLRRESQRLQPERWPRIEMVREGEKYGCLEMAAQEVPVMAALSRLECLPCGITYEHGAEQPLLYVVARLEQMGTIMPVMALADIPSERKAVAGLLADVEGMSVAEALRYVHTHTGKTGVPCPEKAVVEGALFGYKPCCVEYYVTTRYFDRPTDPISENLDMLRKCADPDPHVYCPECAQALAAEKP